ncbi:hypothetical protein IL306_013348 [Fusarium sp. DS 682]|nr:hypothetical protein IL306_013348 [Fusarium sp. DS 682]
MASHAARPTRNDSDISRYTKSAIYLKLANMKSRLYELNKQVKDRRWAKMENEEREFRDVVMKRSRRACRERQAANRALKDERNGNALKQESFSAPDDICVNLLWTTTKLPPPARRQREERSEPPRLLKPRLVAGK